jgi:hypothetical protein
MVLSMSPLSSLLAFFVPTIMIPPTLPPTAQTMSTRLNSFARRFINLMLLLTDLPTCKALSSDSCFLLRGRAREFMK